MVPKGGEKTDFPLFPLSVMVKILTPFTLFRHNVMDAPYPSGGCTWSADCLQMAYGIK